MLSLYGFTYMDFLKNPLNFASKIPLEEGGGQSPPPPIRDKDKNASSELWLN